MRMAVDKSRHHQAAAHLPCLGIGDGNLLRRGGDQDSGRVCDGTVGPEPIRMKLPELVEACVRARDDQPRP